MGSEAGADEGGDTVVDALGYALRRSADAGRWDIIGQLARGARSAAARGGAERDRPSIQTTLFGPPARLPLIQRRNTRVCILQTPAYTGGMRCRPLKPQDVAIALRLAAHPGGDTSQRALAAALRISASEVNHGLARLAAARLYIRAERRIAKHALLEFLLYGIKYAFPAQLGMFGTGLPTAFSTAPLAAKLLIDPDDYVVWPAEGIAGAVRGRELEPLYPRVPEAAAADARLHEYLALVDAIRVGRARERKLATAELTARLS
jgi:hypothetical protein